MWPLAGGPSLNDRMFTNGVYSGPSAQELFSDEQSAQSK